MPRPTSVPSWATDTNYPNDAGPDAATATKIEPSSGYKAVGERRDSGIVAQYGNWWRNLVYKWVKWLDDVTNGLENSSNLNIAARVDLSNPVNQVLGGLCARGTAGPGFVNKGHVTTANGNATIDLAMADVFLVPTQSANHVYTISNVDVVLSGGKILRFAFVGSGANFVELKTVSGTLIATIGAVTETGLFGWVDIMTNGTINDWTAVGWDINP